MIRSLYTAATGMTAQQLNLDVIANNLANVNTTGFKKSRADFQDLMYQMVQEPGTQTGSAGTGPTGIQIGLGVRPAAVQRVFATGDFQSTGNPLDVALQGEGYLQVQTLQGDLLYTRIRSTQTK
jgi:flagellar basal-body rod protein FlgG